MSMSISGQNERWAQLSANPPPPPSPSGQNSGAATIGTTASTGPAGNPATAVGSVAALSDDMSLALMAFGGGWGNGSATASQVAGQNSGTSGASAVGSDPSTQGGNSFAAQLLTDVQSLVSALTGTATNAPPAPGQTGAGAATGLTGTVQQDLQTDASNLDMIASASGSSQPGGAGQTPSGLPPWSDDISNTGTNAGSGGTNGWNRGYSDGLSQQFALSAYAANAQAGIDSSATSSLANITV